MSAVADAFERHHLTETTLGALAEYITSGSRDWSKYYAASGAIFIRTQDINQNRLSLDAVAYVQLPAKVEGKRSLLRKGDLLITITGANVGKVAVVEQELPEAYVSQSVCLVRLKDPGLARFLQLQLIARRGEKSALESMAYGLGRPVLNLENVRAAPVRVGLPRIRAEIVAELEKQFSRLDEAVANLKRAKANLKRYKAAVLADAVEGALAGDRTEWRPACLGDIAGSVRNGISIKPVGESGTRILRISAVRPMTLDLDDVRFLAQPRDGFESFGLAAGDVLFTRYNGNVDFVGVCAAVPELTEPTVYPDKLIRVRVPSDVLLPSFLVIVASTGEARAFIESRIRTTAGQAGISGADIKAIPLRIAPLREQHRIVAEVDRRLSIVREVEAEVDANLKRAQALRQAVLARAFGGAVDPRRNPQPAARIC